MNRELAPGKNEARIVEVDGGLAVEIELTQGKVALCDLDDWEIVRHRRWYAVRHKRRFYAQAAVPGEARYVYLHRLLLGDNAVVDHEVSSLDNRRSNLRFCDYSQNSQNRAKRPGTTSRFKGVSWHAAKRKWYARINVDGKDRCLGYFDIEEEAAERYDKQACLHYGPFARTNFPNAA